MLGAIAGDMIGSPYEWHAIKSKDFPLFSEKSVATDDSILTIAIADAILSGEEYVAMIRQYGRRYPHAGYGGRFRQWLASESTKPYNSYGNGSAMRVSPVGWAFDDPDSVLQEAKNSAEATHNHPEGIRGAQAVALGIFLARQGEDKGAIKAEIMARFHYDLNRSLNEIRPKYSFDVTCQGSVPQAIIAFLESESYEDCIRNAVSLGGDSDTQAAIAGSIAEAFYGGVPAAITREAYKRLDDDLRQVAETFREKFTTTLA